MKTIEEVIKLTDRITMSLFGTVFFLRVDYNPEGRIFLQVTYKSWCTKTGELMEWHGRKWQLSEHMTDDEVVKTAYAAFQAAVNHEVMEGFKVDNIILFNPHINFEELLAISHLEVKRK